MVKLKTRCAVWTKPCQCSLLNMFFVFPCTTYMFFMSCSRYSRFIWNRHLSQTQMWHSQRASVKFSIAYLCSKSKLGASGVLGSGAGPLSVAPKDHFTPLRAWIAAGSCAVVWFLLRRHNTCTWQQFLLRALVSLYVTDSVWCNVPASPPEPS